MSTTFYCWINLSKKAIKIIKNHQKIKKYEILKHNLNHEGKQNIKISIPNSKTHQFVKVADIIRCEGWQKYTKIYLQSGAFILSSYNIGVFREMLQPYDFYATHKSHLINTTKIEKYIKSGMVILSDNSYIPVSRRKREAFCKAFIDKK